MDARRAALLSALKTEDIEAELERRNGAAEQVAIVDALPMIEARATEPKPIVRSTGWRNLDSASFGGVAEGEVVLVPGWRGSGKTHFAVSLSCNFLRNGCSVLYVSMEDGWRMIADRFSALDPAKVGFKGLKFVDEEQVTSDNVTEMLSRATKEVDVIVVDNLYSVPVKGGGDAIWGAQADFVDTFCNLVRGSKASGIVLHHLNKGRGNLNESWNIAGSTRLQNRVAQVWILGQSKSDKRVIGIRNDKSRRGIVDSSGCLLRSGVSGMLYPVSRMDDPKGFNDLASELFGEDS